MRNHLTCLCVVFGMGAAVVKAETAPMTDPVPNMVPDLLLPPETQWNHFSPELIPDFAVPTRYDAVLAANAPVKWFVWHQAGRNMFQTITNGTDAAKYASERQAMFAKGITAIVDSACRSGDTAAMQPLTQLSLGPGCGNDDAIRGSWEPWTNWWQQIVVSGAAGSGVSSVDGKCGVFMTIPDYESTYTGGYDQDACNHLTAGNYAMLEKSTGYVGQMYLAPLNTCGGMPEDVYSGGGKTFAWFNPIDSNGPAIYLGQKNEGNPRIFACEEVSHYFETWLPENTQIKDAATNDLLQLTHFGSSPSAEHWAARVGGLIEGCYQYTGPAGQKLIAQLKLCADRSTSWQYDWSWNEDIARHRITHPGPDNTEYVSTCGSEMMPGFVAEAQMTLAYFSGADGINFWGSAYYDEFQPRPRQGNPQRGEKHNDPAYGNVDRESYNNVFKALWRMNQKVTLEDGRQLSFYDICDGSEEYLTTNTVVSYDGGLTFKGTRALDWQLDKKTAVRTVVNRNKNVIFILAFQPYGVEQNQVTVKYTDYGAAFTKTIDVPTNKVVLCAYQLAAQSLVHAGSAWKYLATNSAPAATWKNASFVDTNWPSGGAPVGYGNDTDLVTVVSYGPVSTNKYPTTYFRRTFNVSHVKALLAVKLNVRVDDGLVVYLNGAEVGRTNMPAGNITYTNVALGNASNPPRPWQVFNINPTNVLEGTNTLAVEVHQSGVGSGDIYFDLQLQPESVFDWPVPVTHTPLRPVQTSAAPWTVTARTTNSIQVADMQLRWNRNGGAWSNVVMSGAGGVYSAVISPDTLVDTDQCSYEIHTFSQLGVETINGPYALLYTAPHAPDFISADSSWKYRATNTAPVSTWSMVGFDDAAWSVGTAPLGYGPEGEAATVLSYGPDSTNKYPTYYFRKTFTVDKVAAVRTLDAFYRVDDGLVVYLNGHELGRANMASGVVSYATLASAAGAGAPRPWSQIPVDTTLLVDGENTLAVEVHQLAPSSSDVYFDFLLYPSSSQPVITHIPLPTLITGAAPWTVSAVAESYNPLAAVRLFWSQNGGGWTNVSMTLSSGIWSEAIRPGGLADHDSFQYRIEVMDVTGVTITNGPYLFMYPGDHGAPLVEQGSGWEYRSAGTPPPTNWMATNFVSTGWSAGVAPLGYPVGNTEPVGTLLDYGPEATNTYPTHYFRQVFTASNVLTIGSLKAYLRVDDGAVIYINGLEAARTNMPAGNIAYTNLALNGAVNPPRPWQVLDIPPERLLNGSNTIAVEVHQAAVNSSDLFFDFVLQPESRSTALTNWCAYNDLAWVAGQSTSRITLYTPPGPASGTLMDYATGTALPVTATLTMASGSATVYSNAFVPPAGSDADGLFGSTVDCRYYVFLDTNTMILRFGNLHPAQRYSFALYGSRGSNTYTQRWTTVSITGAVSYVNHSSSGATVSTLAQDSDTTRILAANMDGSVFRYDNIDPGMDGKFYLRLTPGGSGFTNAYLTAFMLRTYTAIADADGDGLPDDWEQLYYGGTTNAAGGVDTDGDGLSNLQEYLAGTNPGDAASAPRIGLSAGTNRLVSLDMDLSDGRMYAFYTATNLISPSWTLLTNVAGHGASMTLVPSNATGSNPRYYKVKITYPQ